jgi:hypothetical protein
MSGLGVNCRNHGPEYYRVCAGCYYLAQAEIERLRRIELAARDVVNIALNDAGPAAFETMAELRAALVSTHPTEKTT